MDIVKRIIAAREAGNVERCHTMPHLGSYSNAKHQWGCAILYLQLHPDPRMETLTAILTHDLGERWVGDIPAPTKWALSHDAMGQVDSLEASCLRRLCFVPAELLPPEERAWWKAVDLLDLWLWCHEQLNMGNMAASRIIDNVAIHMKDHMDKLPLPVQEVFQKYRWERTDDIITWKP